MAQKKDNEEEESKGQFTGAVYYTKGGVIDLQAGANPPTRYDRGIAGVPPDRSCHSSTV